ncbi:MAG: rod shape-determining protein MreD [Candidatus Eremiobacteraeota bacterium]|nr:rod shape-determining protein MreD [Candidatus Eremiobacteraeota bacterium]
MRAIDDAAAVPRLRETPVRRRDAARVDAEILVPPKFAVLIIVAAACAIAQATILHDASIHGGRLSLVTVLVVWTGLRCGVTTGGWLGLVCGLLEDALGGRGSNVLGTTLIGFTAGLLSSRFFYDSFPVFLGAVALATIVRAALNYLVIESAFGYRGLFARTEHEAFWQALLNCSAAAAVVLYLRIGRMRAARVRSKAA